MIVLISGGAACGKSAHAERFCVRNGDGKRLYLATMRPFGDESLARIARHRSGRAGKGFETIERESKLEALTLTQVYDSILLEDIGNLVANEMFSDQSNRGETDAVLAARITAGVMALSGVTKQLVIVTNEVFSDGVVYSQETERYRSLLADINARIAQQADVVYESVCGILVPLKGRMS